MRQLCIVLFSMALLGGTSAAQLPKQEKRVCSVEDAKEELQKAPLVAEVLVKKVFSPPLYWSGTFPALQVVEYEVEKMLRGNLDQKLIRVSHLILFNSPLVGERPELDPQMFESGKKLVLMFASGPDQLWRSASDWRSAKNPLRNLLKESDQKSRSKAAQEREESDAQFVKEAEPEFHSSSEDCGALLSDSSNALAVKAVLVSEE